MNGSSLQPAGTGPQPLVTTKVAELTQDLQFNRPVENHLDSLNQGTQLPPAQRVTSVRTASLPFAPLARTGSSSYAPGAQPFGPCSLTCPVGAQVEAEACGTESNIGCNDLNFCATSSFEDVLASFPGATDLCGTVWADAGTRDVDDWRFTLPDTTSLTVQLTSELPVELTIISDPTGDCANIAAEETIFADGCNTSSVTVTLFAGTYHLFVVTGDASGDIFTGFPCATNNDYTVNLSATSADCLTCTGVLDSDVCGATFTDNNGGCLADPMAPPTDPIVAGNVVCGQHNAANGLRDLDWYAITLNNGTGFTEVTVTGSSEGPGVFWLATTNCNAPGGVDIEFVFISDGNCAPLSETVVVADGNYFVIAAPASFDSPDCTTQAGVDYTFTVTAAAATALCPITCPPGADLELEPLAFGTQVNNPCTATPGLPESLNIGVPMCGSTYATSGTRNGDYYVFTIPPGPALEFTISITSNIPVNALITGGLIPPLFDCTGGFFLLGTEAVSSNCMVGTQSCAMIPGDYVLLVTPADATGAGIFNGFPVGFSNSYVIETSTAPIGTNPCSIVPPVGAVAELETCGGFTNNVCLPAGSGPAEPFDIVAGGSRTGTLEADGGRDFDFYSFTVANPATFNFEFASQLPSSVSLVQFGAGGCPAILLGTLQTDFMFTPGDCVPVTGSITIAPGNWLLLVTTGGLDLGGTGPNPALFSCFPCGMGNDYYLSASQGTIGCSFPTGTFTSDCASDILTATIDAVTCYNSIDLEVFDEQGNSLETRTIPGTIFPGTQLIENFGPYTERGVFSIVITANCCNLEVSEGTAFTDYFPYDGETDIIFDAEFKDGCVDSGAALEDALVAAGRSVLRINSLFVIADEYTCLSDPGVENIWAIYGTFPNNNALLEVEATTFIARLQAGVNLGIFGGDIWGFDPETTLRDFDGVAGTFGLGNIIADGNDDLTSMSGLTNTALDLSGLGTVIYAQDTLNPLHPFGDVDFIDELIPQDVLTPDQPAGSTATVVLQNEPDALPIGAVDNPFGTLIHYAPSDPTYGQVLSGSFEVGGFGSTADQAALLTAITGKLNQVSGTPFVRGNCNSDGTPGGSAVNIADAVYLLGYLFPGATVNFLACADACDANDDGSLNIADAIATLSSLFGSPTTPLPIPNDLPLGTGCGLDPTDGAPFELPVNNPVGQSWPNGLDCAAASTACP